MAESLPLPKGYKRLGAFPVDEDSVFYDLASMEAYIAGASSYPGHVVALVDQAKNEVHTFKVLPDKTYEDSAGKAAVFRRRVTPLVNAGTLTIDFDGKNDYITPLAIPASADFAVVCTNTDNADVGTYLLSITNTVVITLPAGSMMQEDDRYTPLTRELVLDDGEYELSSKHKGANIHFICSQKFLS